MATGRIVPVVLLCIVTFLLAACGETSPPTGALATQTISFAALPDRLTTDPPFDVSASASSGLPVEFSAEGVCTVAGTTVTLSGSAGTCTITAHQAGDSDYQGASDVARSFTVRTAVQRVGFVLLSDDGVSVGASGSFASRAEAFPIPVEDGAFGAVAASCAVITVGADPGGGDPVPSPSGTPADAGQPLTVTHGDATYLTLVSDGVGTYVLGPLPGPTPPLPDTGLSLDVPGGDVPAASGLGFAPTAALTFTAGFDPAFTTGATFTWTAPASVENESVVLLVGHGSGIVVSCVVPDTGTFAFPQETIDALTDAGFSSGTLVTAGRLSVRAHVSGFDATLLGVLRLTQFASTTTSHTTVDALVSRAFAPLAAPR